MLKWVDELAFLVFMKTVDRIGSPQTSGMHSTKWFPQKSLNKKFR